MDCIFCKIAGGEIPAKKIFENERLVAFEDTQPKAPTHVLIIPRKHVDGLNFAVKEDTEMLGECLLLAAEIARQRNIEDGYRTVFNVGPRSGQTVHHLHLHLLGGRDFVWPPG